MLLVLLLLASRGAGPKNDFFQVSFFVLFVAVLCFYVVGKNKNALGIGLNAPNAQAMRIFVFHFFYVSMPAVGLDPKCLQNEASAPPKQAALLSVHLISQMGPLGLLEAPKSP